MGRIISSAIIVVLIAMILWTRCYKPEIISDDNSFLKDFVNQELLSVLGVVVTITLASAASLHLELNRIEDVSGENFIEARRATKSYAYLLLLLFTLALGIVVFKPVVANTDSIEALLNGFSILIVIMNIMALADLTTAVFEIPANRSLK